MSRLAIIPARGGSKRIPHKNIVDILGQPMIAWTIQAALETGQFDKVLVSTDDADIAKASQTAGADVPFLRQIFSDDHSPVSQATIAALLQAEAHWNCRFDNVTQLMPNCPLRNRDDITKALSHFEESQHEFQISAFEFGWMNPWWAMKMAPDGTPTRLFAETGQKRSQDLERLYCPTGAIWIAERDALISAQSFYGPGHVIFPMNWKNAIDIDDYDDLEMATLLGAQMMTQSKAGT